MNRCNKGLGWVFVLVAALLLTVTPFMSGSGSVAFAQTDAKAVTNDQLMPVVGERWWRRDKLNGRKPPRI